MDAAPEWLRDLGRAPGLADDAPARPPNSGRRLRWRATPAAQGRQGNSLVDFRAVRQDVRSLPQPPDLRARPLAVQS